MLRHTTLKLQVPRHPSLRAFGYLAVLLGIAQGIFFAIFPLVLERDLHGAARVGYYYALIGIMGLCASVASTVIFRRVSRVRIAYWSFVISTFAIGFMTLAKDIWHLAGLDIPRAIAVIFVNIAFSLFVADYLKREFAAGQAAIFAWSNLGWLIGPLIGGLSAARWGYEAAFILSSVAFMACLVFFLYQHLIARHPHFTHGTHAESLGELWSNIKAYVQHPELGRVFRVSFGINIWWSVRGIYIPLAIVALGFGTRTVGLVTAGTGIPLILMEFWTGTQAAIRGVRRYIILGFTALTIFATLLGVFSKMAYVLFAIFIIANVGAALIEPLQNTYFLEAVRVEEREHLYGIYNTGALMAGIVAPVATSLIFGLGFGFRGIWIFLAVAMLFFCGDAFFIKKRY